MEVVGKNVISDNQEEYLFAPTKPWSVGVYQILIEARLEDLAGKNLNRVFDEDLKTILKFHLTKEFFERTWQIR